MVKFKPNFSCPLGQRRAHMNSYAENESFIPLSFFAVQQFVAAQKLF